VATRGSLLFASPRRKHVAGGSLADRHTSDCVLTAVGQGNLAYALFGAAISAANREFPPAWNGMNPR
jgi:hypothetical protein